MQPQRDSHSPEDLVSHVIHFCRSLREHGLLVGPSETTDAISSLSLVNILDKNQVYWAFRAVLVSRADEIAAFDDCFTGFWSFQPSSGTRSLPSGTPFVGGIRRFDRRTRAAPDDGPPEVEQPPMVQVIRTGASPVEIIARRDLTVVRGDELSEIAEMAANLARALPSRPGRRRHRHKRKGIPDLRSAFRLNLAHGGDLITLPRRVRVPRPPRILVLLDVSGSMDRHAHLLLQLVYALGQKISRVETFVFSTSLTRVTLHLKAPSFSEALRRVGDTVQHWSGGTRIGECLRTLNHEYAHLLDRNTSVFLVSDGWETGDPDHLAREIARLRRQVEKLVWLNPLLGTPDYVPLTMGLQAARPYVDVFASALDLAHLKHLPGLMRG